MSSKGLIIVTGFLCNYATSCMPSEKCKLRSVYRHKINNTSYSYMKVEVQSGIPTKIAFDGLRTQSFTEFHFKRCSYQAKKGDTPRSVTTMHWKSNINGLKYYLAVRGGKIVLEQVSSVTDHHRFFFVAVCTNCKTYKIQSAASKEYIMTDSAGQATLGPDTTDRKAYFKRRSCS
ncbi:unnamed protein product [Porites lobata]|uniref:Uncharacterized protein n=1 Tax=Porites lobata TaxID=104759 RepID=A0ABN8PAF2_9CNID|nr:unnamed protein product [Porites lobata]